MIMVWIMCDKWYIYNRQIHEKINYKYGGLWKYFQLLQHVVLNLAAAEVILTIYFQQNNHFKID